MRLGVVSQSGLVPIISIMLLLDAHVHKPLGASLSRETRDRLAGNTKREKTQKTNRSRKEEKTEMKKTLRTHLISKVGPLPADHIVLLGL